MSDLGMSDFFYPAIHYYYRLYFSSFTLIPVYAFKIKAWHWGTPRHQRWRGATPFSSSSSRTISGFRHSVRSDFTGFATAALTAWKLMVTSAIKHAATPAIANTHQLISIR
jgi:hypothetical protein